MVYLISIEGVIGCGKSTVIDMLNNDGYKSFPEPINDWTLLSKFYENPSLYAGPIQMQILFSYNKMFHNTLSKHPLAIIERSPWSSRYVFAEMHTRNGNISESQQLLYESYYDLVSFKPDYIIYLETSSKIAYDRYLMRNRSSEADMSTTYIKELNEMYDEAIKNTSIDIELSIVDANRSIDYVYHNVKNIIDTIL